jgi:hypothetical protein
MSIDDLPPLREVIRSMDLCRSRGLCRMQQACRAPSSVRRLSDRSSSMETRRKLSAANELYCRMLNVFTPRLDILPTAQQRLWPELASTPDQFVLYGGTAIALRLRHRHSVDFDFFSLPTFEPQSLLETVPYLKGATVLRSAPNTLTVTVERGGAVQVSFFGNLGLGQVAKPELADGPRFKVAALIDIAGTKAAVVTQRAEVKDYLDIDALLTKGRIPLANMLASAAIIYGSQFSPLISLKAISYHDDASLAELPMAVRNRLSEAVRNTDPANLPALNPIKVGGSQS